jgi:AcrR family transcriptional regulator
MPAMAASRARKRAPRRRANQASAPAPDRILAAALAAFAERGFDGATTREIAAAAGVPQGLVTYHYAGKQALWEAAVEAVFADLQRELGAAFEVLRDVDPETRWRTVIKRFVRFIARRPELHRLMTHEGSQDGPRLRLLVERYLQPLFDASTALIREAAPGVDAAQLHYVLLGAGAHLFAVAPEFRRITGRDPLTPEMIEAQAEAIVDWIVEGALASSARLAALPRTGRKKE